MSDLLTPYTQVLGLRKAKHLLRRATFNYSKSNIDQEILSPTRNVANQMEKCEHIEGNAQSSDSLECK